ncbi:hypothetical protein QTO34_019502 [Cnephaeus nilssonii]|uniref:Uncharacterized protein n=3 Tax=Laurasiatheria TaxID=314145 RepID=A0AA40HX25_CNENI|nr:hypothetical protein QTO34_019502 [Eptesicus nilssonii]
MADPIMDLFDDPNLFGLDSLTDDSFNQVTQDPIEEALGLPSSLDSLDQMNQDGGGGDVGNPSASDLVPPPEETAPTELPKESTAPAPESLTLHDYTTQPVSQEQPAQPVLQTPAPTSGLLQVSKNQEILSQGNPFMGVSATAVSSSSPGGQPPQSAPKIVILKAPPSSSVTGAHVAQIQAQGITSTAQPLVAGTANGGKVTFTKVLTGTPLRPGVSIVSGNTVLAAKVPGNQATVQRIVQPSRPVKQLVLQPVKGSAPAGNPGASGPPLKPAVTLTSTPTQGESKRITLVLQQPQSGGPQGHRHVVLGSLPGKIVLQGNQLAALTQAKNAQGQPAKVVTIQLQVQQPQQKIQIVPQPPSSQPQPQQPPSTQP